MYVRLVHEPMYVTCLMQGLQLIPYKDLGLTCYSKILGQGRHGLVLQADYSSMSTAVKLLLAPIHATAPAPFSPRTGPLRGWSMSSEDMLPPSPRASSGTFQYEGTEADIIPEGAHLLFSRSSLLNRPASIWLLVITAFKKALRAPAYILSVLNGSRWKRVRKCQKVTIRYTKGCCSLVCVAGYADSTCTFWPRQLSIIIGSQMCLSTGQSMVVEASKLSTLLLACTTT